MKISRRQFVKAMAAMSAASVLAACGGNSGSGSSGGKKALTFQILGRCTEGGHGGYVCGLHPAAPGGQH